MSSSSCDCFRECHTLQAFVNFQFYGGACKLLSTYNLKRSISSEIELYEPLVLSELTRHCTYCSGGVFSFCFCVWSGCLLLFQENTEEKTVEELQNYGRNCCKVEAFAASGNLMGSKSVQTANLCNSVLLQCVGQLIQSM